MRQIKHYKRHRTRLRVFRCIRTIGLIGPIGPILAIGTIIGMILILRARPAPDQLILIRDPSGVYAYTGGIPQVAMKTSLGVKDDGINIRVERQNSSIEVITPLTSASIKKDGNGSALYSSSDRNNTYKYGLTPTGLKEDIRLAKKPSSNRFVSVVRVSNLVVNRTSDGLPVFTDTAGNYQFHFARPYAEDASGNRTYNVHYTITPTQDGKNPETPTPTRRVGKQHISALGFMDRQMTASTYTVIMDVDNAWLLDPKRIYPVTIDPTITHNTSSTFATGQTNRIFDTGSGSNPNLTTYYQELPDSPNTIALWHMNETSNGTCAGAKDVCDVSGNANHGTQTSTTITTSNQLLGAAARSLDGTNSFVTVANSASINFNQSNAFTIEAWVQASAVGAARMIVNKQENVTNEFCYSLYMNANNQFVAEVCKQGVAANSAIGTTVATASAWYHVAGVSNGNTVNVYVNGKLETSTTITVSASTQSVATLYIGQMYNNTQRWNGLIDDVRISGVARTSEEIKADAQRRPYGVYTSPIMDLSKATTFTSLAWDERGVGTGDGETASSSTGLVAQWNFNSTSGTTATNDGGVGTCGGVPANCNGTLTSFANTTAQDVIPGSGWTAINRRWGAGALICDGVDDYVTANDASLNITSNITVESWFTASASGQATYSPIVKKADTSAGYSLEINNASRSLNFWVYITGTGWIASPTYIVQTGTWYDAVGTYDGTKIHLYVNGVEVGTGTAQTGVIAAPTNALNFCRDPSITTRFFNGTVDVTRIYNRALPLHEILSNYNAMNMEFETRVGNSSTPDDGTWEAWKPVTTEVQIDSMDSTTALATRINNATYDWTIQNANNDQDWIKYNNTAPAACDSPGNCGNNGSLGIGSAGKSDAAHAYIGSVIYDAGTYKIWYTCHDGIHTRICYATSPDGLTWTKADNVLADNTTCDSGGPACAGTSGMLGLGNTNVGDNYHTYSPTVIKDGSVYKMWYTGYNSTLTPNQWRIFYATSSSGLTWTKYDNTVPAASNTTGTNGRIPVGTSGGDFSSVAGGGVIVSTVIKDGSTYRMWYQGYDGTNWRLYNATSSDGLTWTKVDNTVPAASNTCSTNGRIPLGLNGTAETNNVQYTSVIKDGAIYKMWYTGQDATNNRTLYATSTDALAWCKNNNAVPGASNIFATDGRIPLGSSGGDNTNVLAGPVIKVGNSFYMWYSGEDATTYRIYHARMAIAPVTTSTDSITKVEGTDSRYVSTTPQATDNSVVALWHMDETSGTSGDDYFLKDSSGNGNNAGTVGTTTSVDGVMGRARNFTGSQYLNVLDSASLKPTRGLTLEAWVKPSALSGLQTIIIKWNTTGYILRLNGTGVDFEHQSVVQTAASTVNVANAWYHVVGTWDGATDTIYVNGAQVLASAQATAMAPVSDPLAIGAYAGGATSYFNGAIDEVRILNRALAAEEVKEQYRLGSNYHISKTIASTDISTATKVPFNIASDQLGRIGELTVGNSAYANYDPDANTTGLWHLDENAGSGAYLKDSSGHNNNGTPNGTTFTQGYMGGARSFATVSNDVITFNNIGVGTDYTMEAWILFPIPFSATNWRTIFANNGGTYHYALILNNGNALGVYNAGFFSCGLDISTVSPGWHHFALAVSSALSYTQFYIDANPICRSQTKIVSQNVGAVGNCSTTCGQGMGTTMDEVRFSNVARTADQLRQAYEVGRRTHPIIIDFKAGLSSSGLIASSGTLSFIVDATQYGASNMGSNLYVGDKIIVRENISGTTYVAQGTVTSVNLGTGATSVASWDAGSTFPAGGFTANATVFKWQREWFDPTGVSFSTHRNAITQLTFRSTTKALGANLWLDDLRYGGAYLTTPTGSTITSSTGNRYFQYRTIESSVDTNVSSSLVSATLNYTANSPPNTPSLDSPSNAATNISLTPALKTTTTDADSDYLRYKIVLCTNSGMTTGCQTFDQTSSQTGWSGQNTQTSTAYTSGTQGTYTVQSALTSGTTYYWDSYAIDPGGTNLWSATQGAPNSFTTTGIPTAPTGLLTNGLTNPTGLGPGSTPYFSAVFNAPDASNTTTQAQIQVSTDSTLTGSVTNWDSGFISIASTAQGARSPNINYAGGTLAKNTTFYWRIRFKDASGNTGAWSTIAQFSTTQLFTPPCTAKKNDPNTQITVQWTNNNTINDGYTIERSLDGAGFAALGTTAASGTSIVDGTVANGHTYAYRVKATLGTQVSDWCTTATLSLQQGNTGFSSLRFF